MSDLLPVQLVPVRTLVTLLERGQIELDSTAILVLYVLASSTNPVSWEVWMDHPTIARRTGLSITPIKNAIKRLEKCSILRVVGHEQKGVVRWRMQLSPPGETVVKPAGQTSEVFDPLAFADKLSEPIGEIAPDRVRTIVRYFLRSGSKDKFWTSQITSEESLRRHLPRMDDQCRSKEPKSRTVDIGQPKYHNDTWQPKPLSYKIS
jgi:hypothetical protein